MKEYLEYQLDCLRELNCKVTPTNYDLYFGTPEKAKNSIVNLYSECSKCFLRDVCEGCGKTFLKWLNSKVEE
jgi:hypothetical protein